ncbi:hypothetical protein PFICI_14836 [Pestalotiopsis fici W106-1]|uniref:Uncharacterized protein n=1 Tax=Pestalotiopsis fici (strain W106-1 / CGMCC3.15140) TaxID=1229662 RepID=W3WKB0_PESFW|nr:uncharacterized protein PFICI_14836 [Pestalotiopsis fici W106-1]ETS73231.1 hypothetical protein PFICI_14836 [Pestalotiopsis fici W106-1]
MAIEYIPGKKNKVADALGNQVDELGTSGKVSELLEDLFQDSCNTCLDDKRGDDDDPDDSHGQRPSPP